MENIFGILQAVDFSFAVTKTNKVFRFWGS